MYYTYIYYIIYYIYIYMYYTCVIEAESERVWVFAATVWICWILMDYYEP